MRLLALTLLLAGCSSDEVATDGSAIVPEDGGPTQLDAPAGPHADARADAAPHIEPDAPTGTACRDTAMVLGTGMREWEDLVNGQSVYLYRGPQGGYHLFFSVRAQGLDPSDVYACYVETFRDTGVVFGQKCWHTILTTDVGNGWWQRVGLWAQVYQEYWLVPSRLRGKDVRLDVTVTDKHLCAVSGGHDLHIDSEPPP